MLLDQFKLAHWMNARKYTTGQVAALADVSEDVIALMLSEQAGTAPADAVAAVAIALHVDPAQLSGQAERDLTVVHQSPEALRATGRPIQRDGIHFYNYYTMAAPAGRVAPVILDILCPAGRLPALNNGHLEPAITVNLGPGDIYGRWGTEITPLTWQVLSANTSAADDFIVGDSYVEPSHCPHSYSLVTDRPARIVSYTGQSNVASLVDEVNTWSDPAFAAYLARLEDGLTAGPLLDLLLARRGHDRASAAAAAGIPTAELDTAVEEPLAKLDVLRAVAGATGLDYRLLLPPQRRRDAVGKTCLTAVDAAAGQRRFGAYQVASMANAPHLPDLSGVFLRVDADGPSADAELEEPAECHYLVASGEATLEWVDGAGQVCATKLGADGSAWVGPFVRHRWHGHASVLKFGSGSHLGYLDLFELTNTFDPAATARRCRRDVVGWGYDD